jgi:hypothetical protein
MIGFVTSPATSSAITAAIRDAQTSRGFPIYWLIQGIPIISGEHTGQHFLPASDEMLNTPLRDGSAAVDFPEFPTLISALGGIDARVDIDPAIIAAPEE